MEPEERARAGVFLAFQYPLEIPVLAIGLCVWHTIPAASSRVWRVDSFDFDELVQGKLEVVKMNPLSSVV